MLAQAFHLLQNQHAPSLFHSLLILTSCTALSLIPSKCKAVDPSLLSAAGKSSGHRIEQVPCGTAQPLPSASISYKNKSW